MTVGNSLLITVAVAVLRLPLTVAARPLLIDLGEAEPTGLLSFATGV